MDLTKSTIVFTDKISQVYITMIIFTFKTLVYLFYVANKYDVRVDYVIL